MKRTWIALGTALVFALACSDARAQDKKATESAAVLLERAAFAEEHERDFEAALRLYEQAIRVAAESGDDETRAEAVRARDYLRVRLQKGTAGEGGALPPAVEGRIRDLVRKLVTASEQERYSAQSSLVTFGEAAVPAIEEVLEARGPRNAQGLPVPPVASSWAAQTLADMNVKNMAAMAALERGLGSADPVVRCDIASALSPQRHRALLERAAGDEVARVREIACSKLTNLDDPALMPLMERAAREGIQAAANWVMRRDRGRVIALALDENASARGRHAAVYAFDSVVAPGVANALVAIIEGKDQELALAAMKKLESLTDGSLARASPDLARIEAAVLPWALTRTATADIGARAMRVLGQVGSVRTVEAFVAAATAASDEAHAAVILRTTERAMPGDFDRIAARVKVAPEGTPKTVAAALKALAKVAREAPAASVARGLEGLSGERRLQYIAEIATERQDPEFAPAVRELVASPLVSDRAIQALGVMEDIDSVPLLLGLVQERMARWSLKKLAERKPALFARSLEAVIAAPAPELALKVRAANELPLARDHALEVVKRTWPSAHVDVRKGLVMVLFANKSVEATSELAARFAEVPTEQLQTAIKRFGADLYEPAIPLIGKALDHPDVVVRSAARDALQAFKAHREAKEEFERFTTSDRDARETVEELVKLLEGDDPDTVVRAARAIGGTRAASALPALVKAAARWKGQEVVQRAIDEAIAKIGE